MLTRFRNADPDPSLRESLLALAGFAGAMLWVGAGIACLILAFFPRWLAT